VHGRRNLVLVLERVDEFTKSASARTSAADLRNLGEAVMNLRVSRDDRKIVQSAASQRGSEQTRSVNLGICAIRASTAVDLRLNGSDTDRERLMAAGVNGRLMARRSGLNRSGALRSAY
jgi:uncharacterized protein (DUF1778 family)